MQGKSEFNADVPHKNSNTNVVKTCTNEKNMQWNLKFSADVV